MSENHETTPATGERNLYSFAAIGDGKPELVYIPAGSPIFPNNYFQQQETIWQIVEAVAETDVTYCNEVNGDYLCHFCDGWLSHNDAWIKRKKFVHQEDCIVTKARELIKQRESQPKIIVHVNDGVSPTEIARVIVDEINRKSSKE